MVLLKDLEKEKSNIAVWGLKHQEKIAETSVLVVGSDNLAQKVLGCIIGLGYGRICLMDNKKITKFDEKYFLYSKFSLEEKTKNKLCHIGKSRVEEIKRGLKAIKEVSVEPYHSCSSAAIIAYLIKPDIIIDATNNPSYKYEGTGYAHRQHIPFISVSSTQTKARLTCYYNKEGKNEPNLEALLHENFECKAQGTFTSSIIAGLAAEEARKYTIQLQNLINDKNLENNTPLDYDSELKNEVYYNLKNKKVLIVGAGGGGTFVALDLVLAGVGQITIIDQDTVENQNLNRQILYYNAIGQRKAEVLSKRLNELNKDVRCIGIYGRVGDYKPTKMDKNLKLITEEDIFLKGYNVIFGCADNKEARIFLDRLSQKYSIPYIDGGLNTYSGHVEFYKPGSTEPIGLQVDLNQLLSEEISEGCIEQVNPSVINPNMIIAGAMVSRFLSLYDQPNRKRFIYDSTLKRKIMEL